MKSLITLGKGRFGMDAETAAAIQALYLLDKIDVADIPEAQSRIMLANQALRNNGPSITLPTLLEYGVHVYAYVPIDPANLAGPDGYNHAMAWSRSQYPELNETTLRQEVNKLYPTALLNAQVRVGCARERRDRYRHECARPTRQDMQAALSADKIVATGHMATQGPCLVLPGTQGGDVRLFEPVSCTLTLTDFDELEEWIVPYFSVYSVS